MSDEDELDDMPEEQEEFEDEDYDDEDTNHLRDPARPARASPPPGLRTSKIDLDRITKQLLNVLRRETRALLLASCPGKTLDKDQADRLVKYLKLSKELRKTVSVDAMDKLSDEELEKLTK